MRTIVWFCYFWVQFVCLLPTLRRAEKARAAGREDEVQALLSREVPRWAGGLLRLAGVTVEVTGRENIPSGACVFVGNHRSYYDTPLMHTQLDGPHAMVAKQQIDRIPLVRRWMRLLDCVFLDRDNPRRAMQALNAATELVKNGKSVVIFPEGTRGKGGELELGEFKAGAFRMALKAGAPVVPVAIHGSRDIMENNGGWMKPTHVTIRILPPVPTAGLSREEQKQLPGRTASLLLEALRPMQKISTKPKRS